MGQIVNTGTYDKKFIALGNREMLVRRIYWPMEEFLRGEHELTIGLLCAAVDNDNTSSTWAEQTLEMNDANSFYFGLRSVSNTSSMEYEFLPYSSGSAFVGMKSSGSIWLQAGWSGDANVYDRVSVLTGDLQMAGKGCSSSEWDMFASSTYNANYYFGANLQKTNNSLCAPVFCTSIAASFKYNKESKQLFTKWKYNGADGGFNVPSIEKAYITSSVMAKTHLMSVMNYDSAYFNVSGSATSSIDLTNDDIMNFFVFWPFTTARLAVHAYGWQLT